MSYFDTAAMVTILVLLGQVLELRARARPVLPSGGCSAWHQDNAAVPAEAGKDVPIEQDPATCCAFAPARRCPSMV